MRILVISIKDLHPQHNRRLELLLRAVFLFHAKHGKKRFGLFFLPKELCACVFLCTSVFVPHLSPDGDLQLGSAFVVHWFVQNHTSTVGKVNSEEVCIGLQASHDRLIL